MEYNKASNFIGIESLKDELKKQLKLFKKWASKGIWAYFHSSHYDWWMFPIDEPSSFGYTFTVYEGDIIELKKDSTYIENYLCGAKLLALSWGWDLEKREHIQHPTADQKWQHWPIRLYKASKSLTYLTISSASLASSFQYL